MNDQELREAVQYLGSHNLSTRVISQILNSVIDYQKVWRILEETKQLKEEKINEILNRTEEEQEEKQPEEIPVVKKSRFI
jgi:hypothetical protein